MLRRLLLALSALVIGGAAVPTVHSQEAATVRISSVDASEYPHITANLDVLDATQRPVLGLDQGAFAAALGSSPVAVTSVAGASDQGLGLAVVLTFDVSGSMQGAPLAAAKDAGNALISQLGPNDQVAIMAFSDGVRAVQPFTQDRAVLTTAIDGLASSGNTALYSAVVASAQMAGSSGLPRRAVVLLSDGIDFGGGSQTDAAGSAGAAQASGVPFFVVGLGGQIDQAYLDQLASASRGQLLLAPDPQVLGALYTNIGDILRHQYALRIDASGIEAVPGAELTVTVAAAGTSTSATATLQFPAGILPTATIQATPPAVATPAPRTNQEPAGGGGISLVLVLIVAAAGLGGGVPAFVFLRRRAKTNAVEGELVLPRRGDQRPVYAPIEPAVPASPAGAHLEFLGTEGARSYPIHEAATVGFTPDCTIQLMNGGAASWEKVRIWRREGRYMVHNLSRIGTVTILGKPVTWAVLEDGDELQIGPQKVVFHEQPA